MKYRSKIDEYVDSHKQEMLDDICTLCRINSEKTPYKEGMPYGEGTFDALFSALHMAEEYGFSINNYDNYVGTIDLNEKERQLDILAHLDVVPAGEGWTVTEPFEPLIKDGKLYARGAADDKGPAIAAFYAMKAVKELKIPLQKNVRLILGSDEECGSSDIGHYYAVEKEAPMTFSPDAEFPVTNTEKGGLAAHFTAEWKPSDSLPKVVSIEAGIKVNVVPGKAFAVFEGLKPEILEEMAEKIEKETKVKFLIREEGSLFHVTAEGVGAHAAYPTEGNNALTGLLRLIVRLPFAPCKQIMALHDLDALLPHGDVLGKAMGIAMKDEISGPLTLAFSLLKVTDCELDATFDSRCPLCSTEVNVLAVVKKNLAGAGFVLHNEAMKPPHHVDGSSHFVMTLLKAYEDYTGQKGECQSTGGGTYVHELKNGVAFGASMPGTDNKMHGADEFAVVEDLLTSAKIFAQVIVELCS